jgi:hypothetical protein
MNLPNPTPVFMPDPSALRKLSIAWDLLEIGYAIFDNLIVIDLNVPGR